MVFVDTGAVGIDGVGIKGSGKIDVYFIVEYLGTCRQTDGTPPHGVGKEIVTGGELEAFQQFDFFKILFSGGVLVVADLHFHIVVDAQV